MGNRKSWFILFILGLVGALDCMGFACDIDIYGHRGARGLSPENTLPAYKTALALGVDYVDMDINMTKDGVLVVTHHLSLNPNLTRKIGGKEYIKSETMWIKNFTFEELQAFDVGRIDSQSEYAQTFPAQHPVDNTKIPKLLDAVRYVKEIGGGQIKFVIEIKTDPTNPEGSSDPNEMARELVKILEQENIVERTEVQSFDFRSMLAIQELNPNVITQYLTEDVSRSQMLDPDSEKAGLWTAGHLLKNYSGSIPKMIAALGGKAWGVQDTGLTKALVQEAHDHHLKVVVWSWPRYPQPDIDLKITERVLGYGIDGIISDRPDIVRELMTARRISLPPSCTVTEPCK